MVARLKQLARRLLCLKIICSGGKERIKMAEIDSFILEAIDLVVVDDVIDRLLHCTLPTYS